MNIGIFDSGRGGQLVAAKLRRLLPQHNYTVIDDRQHAPYGNRDYPDIRHLTINAIQPLIDDCPIIVIACNTATAAAITELRHRFPSNTFIGFEPMIKPAAMQSTSQHIALLATHATQHAERTAELINRYAPLARIDMVNTASWASLVDSGQTESIDLSPVVESINHGSDSIIIGCTHYIDLLPRLSTLSPTVKIYEPTESVAREISRQANLQQQ